MQIDLHLEQVLNHLEATLLNGIVQRSLACQVHGVVVCSHLHKLPRGRHIAFADAVVDRGLAVDVHVVDVAPIVNQELDQIRVPSAHGVVER